MEVARGELLLARIIDFARFLWELGLDIGPGRVVELVESLPLIDIGEREEFYTFLKVSLVSKREQLRRSSTMAFAYFWLARSMPATDAPTRSCKMRRRSARAALASHAGAGQGAGATDAAPSSAATPSPRAHRARPRGRQRQEEEENAERTGTYSHEELLRRKDFEEFT